MKKETLASVTNDIRERWPEILEKAYAKGLRQDVRIQIPGNFKLLGSSHKINLSESVGFLSKVCYMSPSRESGIDTCGGSSSACELACLKGSGLLYMKPSFHARLRKTALFFGSNSLWNSLAKIEIASHVRKSIKTGLQPAVRIDGTSDIGRGATLAPLFPSVQFYDYTKMIGRAMNFAKGNYSPNYYVVFSYSGENWNACEMALSSGVNVAVVFDTATKSHKPGKNGTTFHFEAKKLPRKWKGYKVIDGDVNDCRWADGKRGVIVGLRFKQLAGKQSKIESDTGFIVRT